ncbi:FmtA-like protein [Luteitalea pratensis]|uniref:FmtA-like protein n=1 Tax=Luteitalea pratensis TaxID=1855912 RepID=A0A143PUW0_LUTPR|nr:serine hydrolase domain-containing protein [Luteitalea pratensis]AMY12096.1 FmtA-like protein [Luteitalea pratensis]
MPPFTAGLFVSASLVASALVTAGGWNPAAAGHGQAATAGAERLTADTPRTTTAGNGFIAPSGWSIVVRGPATILEAPEGGSRLALIDVQGADAEAAVTAAWAAYPPQTRWPLKVTNDLPDRDGWSRRRQMSYQTSPNERRDVAAFALYADGQWTVVIYDMAQDVGEKRGAQVSLVFDRLLPKGYTRETFAGKKAHPLDAARIAALGAFVEAGRKATGVPGVSVGLVQDGKTVFAGGFGVRELGTSTPVDADSLYMIASNTKALTTLLLARLVDQHKITWDTPVTTLLPSFRLGDEATTRQVLVKHLICACTGLPRQDFEWLFEFKDLTPERAVAALGSMQPTSKFGEMFQYSNPLAGAAGFIGGHVLFPDLDLGTAYDRAMQEQVLTPLGMTSTTFDYARALAGNHAAAHASDVDGHPAVAAMAINYSIIPVRPAGAAWSNVTDMLKYVQMELAQGNLPGGVRYVAKAPLLERRVPQVPTGKDSTYGMGLSVDTTYGVSVVHHGGDMIGFHSDMIWLPDHNVGAVILTNGDPGWLIRGGFRRKLLEVLFDGRPEADAQLAAGAKTYAEQLAAERKLLTVPAEPALAGTLAARYSNAALGEIAVSRNGAATIFDFGEWKSEVGSRTNPDGSVSFLTTEPGLIGFEFVVVKGQTPSLILRDAQHEYRFEPR